MSVNGVTLHVSLVVELPLINVPLVSDTGTFIMDHVIRFVPLTL